MSKKTEPAVIINPMKFYESEYEEALINLLTEVGWSYTCGSKLHRTNREIQIGRAHV